MKRRALEGVTIVAASLAEAGPAATQILSALGAEVIHIERPVERPMPGGWLSTCKKCITLDTKSEEGKALLRSLLEKADVFFENFAPGAWEKMGFGYEEVRKIKPDIIYATTKGFAKDSIWGNCVTYDPCACGSGGGMILSGYEGMDPLACGVNVGDSGSAIHAAMAITAAILQKKLTGKGQFLENPMQHAVIAECRSAFAEYYLNNGQVRRPGNSYRGLKPCAPHNVYSAQGYDTTGNYVVISCSADEDSPDFENLCKAIGRKDLLSDPRYATPALRYENRFALDNEIEKWTIKHSRFDIMNLLAGKYKIPCGAVLSPADICANEFLQNDIVKDIPNPGLPEGYMRTPTVPIKMSECDTSLWYEGSYDEANEEIYGGMLGLSKEEIEDLKAKKII